MLKLRHRAFRALLRKYRKISIALLRIKLAMMGQIVLSRDAVIEPRARLIPGSSAAKDWSIRIGSKTTIKDDCILAPRNGFIDIGDNCSVNPFCVFLGYGGITIGNNVRIASSTSIVGFTHEYADADRPIIEQGNSWKGVVIEDDVWIGTGVRILDGVYIGKGAVIGAGSVVNRSVNPYSVVAGVPAREIKSRSPL